MTLCFRNISHAYDEVQVLSELNLDIPEGEITCLLGPSGGGKSTLLRLVAGLERVQSGSIELDGSVLAAANVHPAPEKRSVGLMFQENALFPHLTVERNVAFGLAHLPASEKSGRVHELLEMVGLSELAKRFPHQLSGGQQQRVALVRSLAPQPDVLLMDEPFASVDVTLRRSLREASRQLLKQNGTTTIMVTHDPNEAMEMGDLIAVLDQGKIIQAANPHQLYEQPASAEVASLFGDAQSITVQLVEQGFESVYGKIFMADSAALPKASHYRLVVRADSLMLEKDATSALQIIDLRFVGTHWIAFLLPKQSKGVLTPLRVSLNSVSDFKKSDTVKLSVKRKASFIFPLL